VSSTDAGYDPATQPKRPDATLGELFGEMTSDLSQLFRQEIELAKTEARDEVAKAGKGAGMIGAAGVAALLTLIMVSFALAWLLDQGLNTALSFLIVGLLWAVVGAVLLSAGRHRLKAVRPLPTTTQTLKEDVEWAKAQKS
jgi:F0F1-type ATP synthase assembly protein I